MFEQIFTDNEAMTQREKGQMILHQDRFKMSTLDQFFRDRDLLCVVVPAAMEIKPITIEVIKEEEEEDAGRRGIGHNKQKDSIWKRAHLT